MRKVNVVVIKRRSDDGYGKQMRGTPGQYTVATLCVYLINFDEDF